MGNSTKLLTSSQNLKVVLSGPGGGGGGRGLHQDFLEIDFLVVSDREE